MKGGREGRVQTRLVSISKLKKNRRNGGAFGFNFFARRYVTCYLLYCHLPLQALVMYISNKYMHCYIRRRAGNHTKLHAASITRYLAGMTIAGWQARLDSR